MKLPLVATRLIIIAFKLMVVAIVVLSIVPLLTGGIGLDLDGADNADMTMDDGTIRIDMPITVRNEGFFDINDLQVSFTFMDENGTLLAESEGEQVDIPVGGETEVPIALELDLYDLDRPTRSDLIFNGTDLKFDVKVSAKYTMDLVKLSVEAGSDMSWGPFVNDLQVQEWNAQVTDEGDEQFVSVPFSFRADDAFNGLQAVTVTDYRDGNYTSNVTQTVHMSSQVNEMAKIPISQEAYDRLMSGTANATVRTTLYVFDCSTYDDGNLNMGGGGGGGGGGIGQPVKDLQPQMAGSFLAFDGLNYNVVVPYSYNTSPAYQGQEAHMLIEYWDDYGFNVSIWQTVYLWDNSWQQVWLPLSPEAYDHVTNGNEVVHVRVTAFPWIILAEQTYSEPWGAGP
ncbi:MAG TPA: hypothetical protein P5202_03740 [Methanomassiliicoccales archaeon]|nr:hypothetical protein [Methanomassiliicoccales archaeon]HNX47296.1 hypothetical protein [Methanomassiliicoccales archaeon]HPR98457.1 hypothetical protein [Methanomassiliicoccales archaeon]HSA35658.1 hypothetical protein [Methanomassiliicoccales archaeon]